MASTGVQDLARATRIVVGEAPLLAGKEGPRYLDAFMPSPWTVTCPNSTGAACAEVTEDSEAWVRKLNEAILLNLKMKEAAFQLSFAPPGLPPPSARPLAVAPPPGLYEAGVLVGPTEHTGSGRHGRGGGKALTQRRCGSGGEEEDASPSSAAAPNSPHPSSETTRTPPSQELLSPGSTSCMTRTPPHQDHGAGTCKPCLYFNSGLCHKGRDCTFCHLPHDRKQIGGVRPSKRTRVCLQRRSRRALQAPFESSEPEDIAQAAVDDKVPARF